MNTGDHVALIYPPGVDLIAAFYGCLYVGVVPVTIRPPHPQVRVNFAYFLTQIFNKYNAS